MISARYIAFTFSRTCIGTLGVTKVPQNVLVTTQRVTRFLAQDLVVNSCQGFAVIFVETSLFCVIFNTYNTNTILYIYLCSLSVFHLCTKCARIIGQSPHLILIACRYFTTQKCKHHNMDQWGTIGTIDRVGSRQHRSKNRIFAWQHGNPIPNAQLEFQRYFNGCHGWRVAALNVWELLVGL